MNRGISSQDLHGRITQLGDRVKLRRGLPAPAVCRALRRSAGISAEELGEAIGVSGEAILAWERNDRQPRGANRDAYARALRVLQETQLYEMSGGAKEVTSG
ncbi:MAG: helix-turn-helix transcriptional regulator, partial [Actinomycetota bacterium]|nr:helix-turn-helix transcriptional regulator [Actinomycetota bacterium]